MNTIPLLYQGQAGKYYGTPAKACPKIAHASINDVGQILADRGLIYCGKLTCSQFAGVDVYAYTTPDLKISVSLMTTTYGFSGIDCVSKFADDSFLTTTTVRVVPGAYEKQRLFRYSCPDLNAVELLTQHTAALVDFEQRCGTVQAIYRDLLSIAHTIDEYNLRQKSNQGYGFITYAGGLAQVVSKLFR